MHGRASHSLVRESYIAVSEPASDTLSVNGIPVATLVRAWTLLQSSTCPWIHIRGYRFKATNACANAEGNIHLCTRIAHRRN